MNTVEKSGRSYPLGATIADDGVNFSVFSRNASGIELLLFDRENDARPAAVFRLGVWLSQRTTAVMLPATAMKRIHFSPAPYIPSSSK